MWRKIAIFCMSFFLFSVENCGDFSGRWVYSSHNETKVIFSQKGCTLHVSELDLQINLIQGPAAVRALRLREHLRCVRSEEAGSADGAGGELTHGAGALQDPRALLSTPGEQDRTLDVPRIGQGVRGDERVGGDVA